MGAFVALLRAVNVGGTGKLPMSDLKTICEELGFASVRTYIASGNVVFASPNAISAYHRMGLTSELEGHNLISVTRPLIGDPFEAQELASHVRDSLAAAPACAWKSMQAAQPCCCAHCRWWCRARLTARRC